MAFQIIVNVVLVRDSLGSVFENFGTISKIFLMSLLKH
jgi:hypothetical protein